MSKDNYEVDLPDGTTLKIPINSMSPTEFADFVIKIKSGNSNTLAETNSEASISFTPEQIWNSSKKEKVALYVRNFFSRGIDFTAKDIYQSTLSEKIFDDEGLPALGGISPIGTYLTRLSEDNFLQSKKIGNTRMFSITDQLIDTYPSLEIIEIQNLAMNATL